MFRHCSPVGGEHVGEHRSVVLSPGLFPLLLLRRDGPHLRKDSLMLVVVLSVHHVRVAQRRGKERLPVVQRCAAINVDVIREVVGVRGVHQFFKCLLSNKPSQHFGHLF